MRVSHVVEDRPRHVRRQFNGRAARPSVQGGNDCACSPRLQRNRSALLVGQPVGITLAHGAHFPVEAGGTGVTTRATTPASAWAFMRQSR